MRKTLWAILFIVSSTLIGCGAGYKWTKNHPAYKSSPQNTLYVIGADKAFVLNRSAWFAKKLNIPSNEIQEKIGNECTNLFIHNLEIFYPELKVLSYSLIEKFPEESEQIDTRIFIKGKFPEQGVSIQDTSKITPNQILIIHEAIIGTDLKREDFYDYALIHNESPEKKTSKNLTAIISYTLWDNIKQRPLFSGIDQIDKPIEKISVKDLEILIQEMVKKIHENLEGGISK